MQKVNLIVMACLAMLIFANSVLGQAESEQYILDTESVADRTARMAWWKEARFGMFVHWGLYSSAEGEWGEKSFNRGAEWIQKKANVPADVYEETMRPKFKPSEGFAAEWAQLAKRAGAKYIVYTNKHHEGFSMHDSAQTEYDAKDFTGRDLHREIVSAMQAEGLRVGVYHSLWDWHHPHAPAGKGSINVGGTSMANRTLSKYTDYLHAQVNEITDGRYGDVDILWLDYSRPPFQGEAWRAKELVELVRKNQPGILINNRLWKNTKKQSNKLEQYWFGDFSTPEQHIPANGIEGVDWETCDTLNITWGWSKSATNYKSSTEVIHRLIETVSKGGNYLLNIGPLPDGSIDPKSVERFNAIGDWMAINGEAIYGTQAGPFTRLPWGRATAKTVDDGSRLYLHVFQWPENGELFVPGLQSLPARARIIGSDAAASIEISQTRGGVLLAGLAADPVSTAATVVELHFAKEPQVAPFRIYAATDGSFALEPADATIKGARYHDNEMFSRSNIDSWKANSTATFPIQVETAGNYEVLVQVKTAKMTAKAEFVARLGEVELPFAIDANGNWRPVGLGTIELSAGERQFQVRCKSIAKESMVKFATISLQPAK